MSLERWVVDSRISCDDYAVFVDGGRGFAGGEGDAAEVAARCLLSAFAL